MLSYAIKRYLSAAKRWPTLFSYVSMFLKHPVLFGLKIISYFREFWLPKDPYLPPHKITMILGLYERDTMRLCKRLIKPGMVVVDGGAHAGYFTRLFSRWTGPDGKVFAFEPHPVNFRCLQKNLASDKYANVTFIQKAVGSGPGTATLFESEGSVGHSLHEAAYRNGGITVEIDTIDSVLAHDHITKVDFVKLDVEGNEIEALKGMRSLLANSPEIMLILEYRRDNKNISAVDLFKSLSSLTLLVFSIADGKLVRLMDADDLAPVSKCNILATRKIIEL